MTGINTHNAEKRANYGFQKDDMNWYGHVEKSNDYDIESYNLDVNILANTGNDNDVSASKFGNVNYRKCKEFNKDNEDEHRHAEHKNDHRAW